MGVAWTPDSKKLLVRCAEISVITELWNECGSKGTKSAIWINMTSWASTGIEFQREAKAPDILSSPAQG